MLPRINSPVSHHTEQINFPTPPLFGCFWGVEKTIGFFVTSIEFLRPGFPAFYLSISGKHIFILAWSFDYSSNSVWLHLKCSLAQLWLPCQLVLQRWVTWGCCMCVCMCVFMCVCGRERETERDVSSGEAVSDAVQRESFNNNLAGETIWKRQIVKYCFLENMVDMEKGDSFISIQHSNFY